MPIPNSITARGLNIGTIVGWQQTLDNISSYKWKMYPESTLLELTNGEVDVVGGAGRGDGHMRDSARRPIDGYERNQRHEAYQGAMEAMIDIMRPSTSEAMNEVGYTIRHGSTRYG
ncbi:hypothetical protein LTR37_008955 [Vermiconidia calcicola]|uniref:Uncharacterized protein n=1 Tax=Vermiconidia calcicola TaxID=1690605 RepID=A0ACC3N9G0_9PEZI|nr:hypothetical protein LTR37_008955 [Vermiconidia calcicola]